VQKAGCSSPSDDPDAVLRSGLSEKRVAVPRQVTGLKGSLAERPGAADA
jgi:hypothetical protein